VDRGRDPITARVTQNRCEIAVATDTTANLRAGQVRVDSTSTASNPIGAS